MSLLERGPHTLTVQNKKPADTTNVYGETTYVDDGAPVQVRGSMQPLTSTEGYELGLEANTGYRFICRVWPGSFRSEISWDDRAGRKFTPVGEPADHSTGHATKHHTVTLQALGARQG